MTVFTSPSPFTAPGTIAVVSLVLEVTVASQSPGANTSDLDWQLRAVKGAAGSPNRAFNDAIGNASVHGSVFSSSSLNYSFPAGAYTLVIDSGTKTVAHDGDGSKTIYVSASYDGKNPLGTASIGSTAMVLPKINRNIVYVGVGGVYALHEVFVGDSGAWKAAQPSVGDSGAWKQLTT